MPLLPLLLLQRTHAGGFTLRPPARLRLCVHLEVRRDSCCRLLVYGSAVARPPGAAESPVSVSQNGGSAQRGCALSERKSGVEKKKTNVPWDTLVTIILDHTIS